MHTVPRCPIQDRAHLSNGNCLHFKKPTYYQIQCISLQKSLWNIQHRVKASASDIHQYLHRREKRQLPMGKCRRRHPKRMPTWISRAPCRGRPEEHDAPGCSCPKRITSDQSRGIIGRCGSRGTEQVFNGVKARKYGDQGAISEWR